MPVLSFCLLDPSKVFEPVDEVVSVVCQKDVVYLSPIFTKEQRLFMPWNGALNRLKIFLYLSARRLWLSKMYAKEPVK